MERPKGPPLDAGGPGSHDATPSDTTAAAANKRFENTSPNTITDGYCNSCSTLVNAQHSVQCFSCKLLFHAVSCNDEKFCVAAPSTFTNHILPAINRTGPYATRFGALLFVCDFCRTCDEINSVASTSQRVDMLEQKIDTVKDILRMKFRN